MISKRNLESELDRLLKSLRNRLGIDPDAGVRDQLAKARYLIDTSKRPDGDVEYTKNVLDLAGAICTITLLDINRCWDVLDGVCVLIQWIESRNDGAATADLEILERTRRMLCRGDFASAKAEITGTYGTYDEAAGSDLLKPAAKAFLGCGCGKAIQDTFLNMLTDVLYLPDGLPVP